MILKCVVGGERKPEFVMHSIQWVDQTNGRTINTFREGRTVTDKVRSILSAENWIFTVGIAYILGLDVQRGQSELFAALIYTVGSNPWALVWVPSTP